MDLHCLLAPISIKRQTIQFPLPARIRGWEDFWFRLDYRRRPPEPAAKGVIAKPMVAHICLLSANVGIAEGPTSANSRQIWGTLDALALAELEALARALLAVLLALFLPRVTRHQACRLHLGAQLGVELLQRARHTHAHRAGLRRYAAARAVGDDVKVVRSFGEKQCLARDNALHVGHKVFLEALAVHLDDAGAGAKEDAGHARFAAARSVVLNQFSHSISVLRNWLGAEALNHRRNRFRLLRLMRMLRVAINLQ